jgi:alkaline phosphatase
MFGRKFRLVLAVFAAMLLTSGNGIASGGKAGAEAKYLFVFIGDGMGIAQRNAAELYLGKLKGVSRPEETRLVMNSFPAQGINTTYDVSSVIPDSASAGTAIACGRKTEGAVIGMDAEAKTSYENIAELAKKHNRKIGILTTVSLDHATPAAFYAHVPSRRQMYEISMQLANSGVDYFAGGQLMAPTDRNDPGKPNAVETAKKNGYTIAFGRQEFQALRPGMGKVIVMSGVVDKDAAMYFTLDQGGGSAHVTLVEYLSKAVELLDNPNGFFIMAEGGKIDWACHANDAAAAIHDTLALDEAVAAAVRFYEKHPEETLIVVTGDHETGGLAIGFTGTGYSSYMDKLQYQKSSYIEFSKKFAEYKKTRTPGGARLEDLMPLIKENFGLYIMPSGEKESLEKEVSAGKANGASADAKKASMRAAERLKSSMALTNQELKTLRDAFQQSMRDEKEKTRDDGTFLLYGREEPLVVKLTTILGNKAGLGWTSFAHTGVPVQTSALGAGAEAFNGYYDQADIYTKMVGAAGLGTKP